MQHCIQWPGHGSNLNVHQQRKDKEDVVHIYTGNSAIKGNETGSFGKTLMDLETVIQREVSQKERNKHYILMHTHEI